MEAHLGDSIDILRVAEAIAPTIETSRLHAAWLLLGVASARFSPLVSVRDPLSGTNVPLTLATVLVGPYGRWHDLSKQLVWGMCRRVGIHYDQADTGGERPGAVAAIRRGRLNRLTEQEIDNAKPSTLGPESVVVRDALRDLVDFDSSDLVAREPGRQRSSIFHAPSELTAFFHPSRAELYHHVYSGLQQEVLAHSQKNESYHIGNINLTLFGTATLDSVQLLFPNNNAYLKHMTRFSFVYADRHTKWTWGKTTLDEAATALENFEERLRTDVIPTQLTIDSEAAAYFIKFRDYGGFGSTSRQTHAYQLTRSGHWLRVAGLLTMIRDPQAHEITLADMRAADMILCGLEERLQYVYLMSAMGFNGRILAMLNEAHAILDAEKKPMINDVAIAWCVGTGLSADLVTRAVDALILAKLLVPNEKGGLSPLNKESSLLMLSSLMIRMKFNPELATL